MKQTTIKIYPETQSQEEHRQAWLKVKGLWKNKKPDPIKYLKILRKSWERVDR